MRRVFKCLPVVAELGLDLDVLSGLLEGLDQPIIQRPVPADRTCHERRYVDGEAMYVPRLHGLGCARRKQFLLALDGTQTLNDRKIQRRDL